MMKVTAGSSWKIYNKAPQVTWSMKSAHQAWLMLMLGCLDTSSVVTVKENGGKVTVEAGPLKLTCCLCGTTCKRAANMNIVYSALSNNIVLPR